LCPLLRADRIGPRADPCRSVPAGNLAPMTEPTPSDLPEGAPVPAEEASDDDRFAGLAERPVAEHVEVFEDEHGRLQRELGTIDQL
jgi:hypothetical protein